jgi:D-amino-acid dehydrogenase
LRIEPVKDPALTGEGDWSSLQERGISLGEEISHYAALKLPGARLSPSKLLKGLQVIIKNFNGNIIHDSIVEMRFNGFRVESIMSKRGEEYRGDTFVLAAGVGSGAFLTELGINETIIGDGGEVLQVSSSKHPSSLLYVDDFMIVPKPDGTSWIAGIHRKFENEVAFVKEDEAQLLAVAKKALGEKAVRIGQWAGVRPKVQNKGEAIVQRAPLAKNVIVAAGHSSNGILLSPLVAQEVQDLVMND